MSYLEKEKNKFFENLKGLRKEDEVNLKRSFNRNFSEVDMKFLCSFYKALPYEVKYKEFIWYFCACLYEYQGTENGKTVPSIIRSLKDENINKRFSTLLHENLEEDSLFLYKLGQMIKLFIGEGYTVDIKRLLTDLLSWDNEQGYVQKNWAKEVYSNIITENMEGN